METEFIFWRHSTPCGINVEEICGGEDKGPALWKAMALQVFGENGGDRFREIEHLPNGAPLLADSQQRISLTHTPHFMAIAFLPRTPEANLEEFSLRTAVGIDAEKADRKQVERVAERVFSPEELTLIADLAAKLREGDAHHQPMEADAAATAAYVAGWTIKEALYKAALTEGLDFREQLIIEDFPELCSHPGVKNPHYGSATIKLPSASPLKMQLFSYLSEGHIVSLAYSPKCSKFRKE